MICDLVAAAGLAAGTLVRLPFAPTPRMFCTLRHAGRYHARAAAALLALTCDPGAGALPHAT